MGKYHMLRNLYRSWGESHRPFPENARWVTDYDSDYDFMLAHIDQQSIYNVESGDRISKGRLFTEAVAAFRKYNPSKPIIVINHMTPFHDKYDSPEVISRIKKMTEGCHMVVNSYQAKEQWGWGTPIIHGLDPEEWYDLPKEPRVTIVLTPAGMDKAYRRIFLSHVLRYLSEYKVPYEWIGQTIKSFPSFEEYRDFIGRSSVFFMPTWQSPRPRARTEAMLSGCCVVTTPYHTWKAQDDKTSFFTDAKDGFLTSKFQFKDPRIIDNPEETAKLLRRLVLEEPDVAYKVGQEGKKLAQRLFNKEIFAEQWENLLQKIF